MAQFKRRERKHRKRTKETTSENTNVEVLTANRDHGTQSKSDLHQELHQPGMSSKKKKRLDKYIETKLKKEENLSLLKKLAQRKVDTSLLQSSKTLGQQTISKREALSQALRKQRAGIATEQDEHLLYEPDTKDRSVIRNGWPTQSSQAPLNHATRAQLVQPSHAAVGTGLKRPLELDHSGQPVLKKRQRVLKTPRQTIESSQVSWDGFDSDESAGQSSSSDTDSDTDSMEDDNDTDGLLSDGGSDEGDDDDDEVATYPLFAIPRTDPEGNPRIKPRKQSEFKTWATQQINKAKDFTPSTPATMTTKADQPQSIQLRPIEEDPLPPELQVDLKPSTRTVYSVQVNRTEAIQESRTKLPIFAEEQKIMEAIHNNPVVLVCGATGSGKTTQIPQFLYEAGYGDAKGPTPGLIGVTQPRRVAAVTMARRVGEELGNPAKASYQIRFDTTVGSETAIKFMTDGILLREVSQELALSKYSVIVIDEAHERSVNTDILIGMISRVVDLRDKLSQSNSSIKPLKLIIMSATLMVDAFRGNSRLFPKGMPPLVESEGRQYPVTMHFSRRTRQDYVQEAFQKITKGHRKLPPGGILVFLTGQNEINELAKKLREALPGNNTEKPVMRTKISAKEAPLEADDMELTEELANNMDTSDEDSGDEQEDKEFDIENEEAVSMKALILPLYSQLPTKEQLRVFDPPPDNTRLIILATNVAETSITIPGIRYVFDSGRSKEKKYDNDTGVQKFEIGWISKASALQRAGRAGRTGPGHCYRLYSSAMFERDFLDHTEPEVLRTPIEGVVLQLKSMGLSSTVNFPFPTPPDRQSIAKAEKLLSYLGALDVEGRITDLGKDLFLYPVSPRFAKMLAFGHQYESIYFATAMVAALAVPELFVPQTPFRSTTEDERETYHEELAKEARSKAYNEAHAIFSREDSSSDAIKLTMALCGYMFAKNKEEFCVKKFLNQKAMKEAESLYIQLLKTIALNLPESVNLSKSRITSTPSDIQRAALKQMVAAGFLDQVAIRADLAPTPPDLPQKPTRSINVAYLTLFPTHVGRTEDALSEVVFVHPSSVLAHSTSAANMPQYLIYSHVQLGNSATIAGTKVPKTWMYPLTAVTGVQLASLAKDTPLLEYGKPIGKIEPGPSGSRNERIVWCVPSLVGERGGRAWPLPARKTLQKRDEKGVWKIEKLYKFNS